MDKTICELFAGVGGFRLGFERANPEWKTVWFNEYNPKKKIQYAHGCYVYHFGDCVDLNGEYHTCEDIRFVDKSAIPNHSVLVGGFPCQDYSIANKSASGIQGVYGSLWWQIFDILKVKRPLYCLFENVDNLLKSPTFDKGRDFQVILSSFNELGYSVEWRVVNSADYGSPQRRKRLYIFAYLNLSSHYKLSLRYTLKELLDSFGFFQKTFPVELTHGYLTYELLNTFESIDFKASGIMSNGIVITSSIVESDNYVINNIFPKKYVLGDILEDEVDEKYFISKYDLPRWIKAKSPRKNPYMKAQGKMPFPDDLNKPSRTIITAEHLVNRTSHIIEDKITGKLRTLTPIETERLNSFDDNWTKYYGDNEMPDFMRYYCMGNALVVPIISIMASIFDVL